MLYYGSLDEFKVKNATYVYIYFLAFLAGFFFCLFFVVVFFVFFFLFSLKKIVFLSFSFLYSMKYQISSTEYEWRVIITKDVPPRWNSPCRGEGAYLPRSSSQCINKWSSSERCSYVR